MRQSTKSSRSRVNGRAKQSEHAAHVAETSRIGTIERVPSPPPPVPTGEVSISERLDAIDAVADSADLATFGACAIDGETTNRSLLAAALAFGDDARPIAMALRALHDDLFYGLRAGCRGMDVGESTVQSMIERIATRIEVLAECEDRLWRMATELLARERQAKAVAS